MSLPLAIDFGTSNSAAAVRHGTTTWRIPIETGSDTLPTAVFFPLGGEMRIGAAAARALIDGEQGRYMRALKSVLGTPLLHESKLVGGKRQSLADIVTLFLAELKRRAEAATGMRFDRALSGRPVHFHSRDAERDARAQEDLRGCYMAAGFGEVDFLFEPEAAALAAHGLGRPGEAGIIVDIGGGTSDFSVFVTEGDRPRILASHGIRLGGTDFDHAVSMAHVMPLLGHGSELKREFGPGRLPVPHSIYVDLARWEKIPFQYTPDVIRDAKQMAKLAVEPEKLERLVTVLTDELGHDIAFAAEAGKIAANNGEDAAIQLGLVEKGLTAPISRTSLDAALTGYSGRLTEAAAETLDRAGVAPGKVASVILVGGSSLMSLVTDEMQVLCPAAELRQSEAFTAVVDGLAIAAAG